MPKNSPIYKIYAPEFNNNFFKEFFETVQEAAFITERIVSFFSVKIPSMPFPDDAEHLGGQDHLNGFHATLSLMSASLYLTLTNNNDARALCGDMKLNKLQMHVMDYGIKLSENFGRDFLDTGRSLILQDLSGKKAMTAIKKFLKSKVSDPDFQKGAEAAESLFLAYWKVMEDIGTNPTDKK